MSNLSSDVPENPDVIKNPKLPAQPEQPCADERGPGAERRPRGRCKTRANRENAQKSMGAKTPAGKEASSKNAVKQGLFVEDLTQHLSENKWNAIRASSKALSRTFTPSATWSCTSRSASPTSSSGSRCFALPSSRSTWALPSLPRPWKAASWPARTALSALLLEDSGGIPARPTTSIGPGETSD